MPMVVLMDYDEAEPLMLKSIPLYSEFISCGFSLLLQFRHWFHTECALLLLICVVAVTWEQRPKI